MDNTIESDANISINEDDRDIIIHGDVCDIKIKPHKGVIDVVDLQKELFNACLTVGNLYPTQKLVIGEKFDI